jgi:SAM-dependent methyltransferase
LNGFDDNRRDRRSDDGGQKGASMNRDQVLDKAKFERVYGADHLTESDDPPVEDVIDALRLKPDSVVVEVGSGQGHFTLPIARELAESGERGVIFAFDYSEEMIDRLDAAATEVGVDSRVRSWPLTRMEEPDTLPIQDAKVDRLLAVNSSHYLEDPLPIYRELARVLKPDGQLLVADWKRGPAASMDHGASPGRSGPELVVADLSKAGFGTHEIVDLDGYSWAIRATKAAAPA